MPINACFRQLKKPLIQNWIKGENSFPWYHLNSRLTKLTMHSYRILSYPVQLTLAHVTEYSESLPLTVPSVVHLMNCYREVLSILHSLYAHLSFLSPHHRFHLLNCTHIIRIIFICQDKNLFIYKAENFPSCLYGLAQINRYGLPLHKDYVPLGQKRPMFGAHILKHHA